MKRVFFIFIIIAYAYCLVGCSAPVERSLPEETDPAIEEVLPPEEELQPAEPVAVQQPEPEETPVLNTKRYIKCLIPSLTVRLGAGTDYSKLGTLDKGDMVVYVAREGGWYKTRYRNRVGYVSAKEGYTSIVSVEYEDERIESVISVGESLLGTPYVYGATRLLYGGNVQKSFDIGEFDCSSLMQYIFYYGADVVLRETTRTQVGQGTEVSKEELRRGDLIFMTNASRKNLTGVERIGHVALYLGDNYILHTASDHAVIEQMSATRWNNYVTARRVL